MVIRLSKEQELIVRSLMQRDRFVSEHDVIGQALRLLQGHDEQARLVEVRREIAIGIEQADRGELLPFDPHDTLRRIRSRQPKTARHE